MKYCHSWLVLGCTLVAVLFSAARTGSAAVIVTSSVIDSFAQALSGRNGSTDGPNVDNPAPTGGTYGAFGSTAFVTAGPIPLDPDNFSFPGTTGVATGQANASLTVSQVGGQTIMSGSLNANATHVNRDNGSYLGHGENYFSVSFTLTEDTPFVMSGISSWHADDSAALIRIINSSVILIGPKDGDPHPFLEVGVLPPGDYEFTTNSNVNLSGGGTGDDSETSSIIATLTLAPEPASLGMIAAGALAVCGRRRRR